MIDKRFINVMPTVRRLADLKMQAGDKLIGLENFSNYDEYAEQLDTLRYHWRAYAVSIKDMMLVSFEKFGTYAQAAEFLRKASSL